MNIYIILYSFYIMFQDANFRSNLSFIMCRTFFYWGMMLQILIAIGFICAIIYIIFDLECIPNTYYCSVSEYSSVPIIPDCYLTIGSENMNYCVRRYRMLQFIVLIICALVLGTILGNIISDYRISIFYTG